MASEISKPVFNRDLTVANKDTSLLAPWFQAKVLEALQACNESGYDVRVTEAYRSPQRQDYLWDQGRSRPGKRVTDAKAWQSWHQYALAIDIAFWDGKIPYWPKKDDSLWDRVDHIMEEHGFESLNFERPHHQISRGMPWHEAYKITKDQGLLALWNLIELRL